MRCMTTLGLVVALCAVGIFLAGCEGEGLVWSSAGSAVGGDQTSGGGDSGTTDGSTSTTPFAGGWAASYSDDIVAVNATNGRIVYTVRLTLTQSGTSISGTGRVLRILTGGATAYDTEAKTFNVTGTASGADATLVFHSGTSGIFDFDPTWYVRLAGSRMIGMYVAMDTGGDIVRSGTAHWYSMANSTVTGGWVTAYTDSYPAGSQNRKDRTGELQISQTGSTITGFGNLFVQRENDVVQTQTFSITRSIVSGQEYGFTFGGDDLASAPVDWFAVFDGNRLVSSYAAFESTAANAPLANAGTAIWYRPQITDPSILSHSWTSSFHDTAVADTAGRPRSNFLAAMTLQGGNGGLVTGTAQILNQNENTPTYRTYDVANGSIIGSQARFNLRSRSDGSYFAWDFQVAGSTLYGSYQFFGSDGRFVSRGTAQWTYQASISPKGTWAAAFFDTTGANDPATDQLALVTISQQTSDGTLSGTGALRFAGDTRRRLFSVIGRVSGSEMIWTWQGTGLFGETTWRLRQGTSNILYGTYVNGNSAGTPEFWGNAIWIKTTTSTAFSELP